MFSLAMADLLSLFYDGFIDELLPLFGIYLTEINNYTCAFGMFFNYWSSIVSLYMTCLFGLDKCLAIHFPVRYRRYGKPKVCVIVSITTCILCAIQPVAVYPLFVDRLQPESGLCLPINF